MVNEVVSNKMTVFPNISNVRVRTEESMLEEETDDDKYTSYPIDDEPVESDEITSEGITDTLGNRNMLFYDMTIKASAEFMARNKARAYVRFKNPFEPNIIEVIHIRNAKERAVMDVYAATIGVRKR